jgi:HEAT repeat protein
MRDETRLQVAGLLHDRSQSVVALAALALGRETPIDRELHRFVADSLTGPLDRWSSVFLQWPTAAALGLAGTNAALFLPALRPLLNHPTNEVRRAVIKAVRRIEGRSR